MKAFVLAFALLLGATTVLFAQSLPNYGPNAPARGDSFGKPYSGAKPLRSGAHAYAYQSDRIIIATGIRGTRTSKEHRTFEHNGTTFAPTECGHTASYLSLKIV